MSFTAIDRCDRCGAQARHRATKPGAKSDLLFCGHHYKESKENLISNYWLIESEEPYAEAMTAPAYTD